VAFLRSSEHARYLFDAMSDYAFVDQHYVPHVEQARVRAHGDRHLLALLSDELDARAQLGFLLEFYAVGVRMLRPIESLLMRGSFTCDEAGFDSLAADFRRQSKDAASRRLRLLDDFVQLAWLWREHGGEALDLATLVRRPPLASVQRHAAVREAAATDVLPLSLLGVELELGELAIDFGPRLVRACERKLGGDVISRLTYLHAWTEHAALRADDLLEQLDELLRAVPELGEPTALAGVDAVASLLDVFADCVVRAQQVGHEHTAAFVTAG
jgi:hypothetical protein